MTAIVIILVVVVIVLAAILLRGRSDRGTAALKRKYRQLRFLSGQEADKALQHQLKAAREKYPGHTEQWYMEKIIYDLERDRR